MIALVMAGGKGTRMNLQDEKLLLKYKKPIILHVIDSLKNSKSISKIFAVTSSNSPKTEKLLQENNVDTIETSGKGYVDDLNFVLRKINDAVLIVSGDLPLLDEKIIQEIINKYDSGKTWTSVLVTKNFLTSLGQSSDYSINFNDQICYYTGISLVNSQKIFSKENVDENYIIINDKRIAFNLNTKQDYDLLSTA